MLNVHSIQSQLYEKIHGRRNAILFLPYNMPIMLEFKKDCEMRNIKIVTVSKYDKRSFTFVNL